MHKLKFPNIYASEIAEYLNSELNGIDFVVNRPITLGDVIEKSVVFIDESNLSLIDELKNAKEVLALVTGENSKKVKNTPHIIVDNPKISFIKLINEYFVEIDPVRIAASAKIDPVAKIGRGVSIGENSVVGPEVVIGNNTILLNNVVVTGRVEIGNNCIIKDNATIGSAGFEFEIDENGVPLHFPHIGKIFIGNNVWVGSNSCIESPAIEDTIINENVKIDDLVQIGASSFIGKGTLITAGVIVSRKARIGQDCLLAPNCCIRESIVLEDGVIVGIGSVVVKNLKKGLVYVGNPALEIKRSENNGR